MSGGFVGDTGRQAALIGAVGAVIAAAVGAYISLGPHKDNPQPSAPDAGSVKGAIGGVVNQVSSNPPDNEVTS